MYALPDKLNQFTFGCWQVIAEHLSTEEVAGIKEAFDGMDTGKAGKINLEQLRVGLQKLGHHIADADLQILMEAVRLFIPSFPILGRIRLHVYILVCTLFLSYLH